MQYNKQIPGTLLNNITSINSILKTEKKVNVIYYE